MQFEFWDLDADTRRYMVEEIEAAIHDENLYYSKRFTADGHAAWPDLLLEAARHHVSPRLEGWLAGKSPTHIGRSIPSGPRFMPA